MSSFLYKIAWFFDILTLWLYQTILPLFTNNPLIFCLTVISVVFFVITVVTRLIKEA